MAFLQGLTGFWLYLFIFVGKVTEVMLSTLRITFVSKGIKKLGILFGAGEVLLWVIITSTVLNGLTEDPFKIVVYCLAFVTGILLGVKIEESMAVGLTGIQIVSLKNGGKDVSEALWNAGFGVTILEGHSIDGEKRDLIFTQLKRKNVPDAIKMINSTDPDAVISISTINKSEGGYLRK